MNTRLFSILALAFLLLSAMGVGGCQLRPKAFPDEATTIRGTPVNINVLANDTDPRSRAISIVDVTDSAKGMARVNPDGTIRYTPNFDALGDDVFSYRIKNTRGRTSTAEVLVRITPPTTPMPTSPALSNNPSLAGNAPPPPPQLNLPDTPSSGSSSPAAPSTSASKPVPVPLPVASGTAAISGLAVTIFTREDDKNADETVQLTVRRGEEIVAQRTLGPEAFPRQTDRTEELEVRPPVPAADAGKLTLEVRKVNSLGAGESWIMQVDVQGRLSDGRTVSLVPKSLPFRLGGGSSNSRSWTFQPVAAPTPAPGNPVR
jgi:hypothetical protein